MAYFKDPNVERLYDIANKTNVKKQEKKDELVADFIDIMDNIVKDINIASRRTFTFGDNSHLLNVALYRNNDWLYEVILERYGDKLSFNTANHVVFSLNAAAVLPKKFFVQFFKPELLESDFDKYGLFYFTYNGTQQGFKNNDDYINKLLKESIQNKDKNIYEFLKNTCSVNLMEKKAYLKARSWFLYTLAEYYESTSNSNLEIKVELENITDKENISAISDLYYSKNEVKKALALNTLSNTASWSFKLKELVKNLKVVDQYIPANDAIKTIIRGIFSSSELIQPKDLEYIINVCNTYLTNEEKIDMLFLEISYKYSHENAYELGSGKREEQVSVKHNNIKWEWYKLFYEYDPEILTDLKKMIIPRLSYHPDSGIRNNIRHEMISEFLNIHNSLTLDSFGFDQNVISHYFKQLFNEAFNHVKRANNRDFNHYLERDVDFFLKFLDKEIMLEMTAKFKQQSEQTYAKVDEFLKNLYYYHNFQVLSPWILLSFIPEQARKFLNITECQEDILEQLIFFKTFGHSTSFNDINYFFDKQDEITFFAHIDKCIDLIYEQCNNLSLSREDLNTVIKRIPENIDVKKDSLSQIFSISSSIKQQIVLNKQIFSNNMIQKKRL